VISLNYRSSHPIYEQIKTNFRNLIATGVLSPGEKLPSVRELAVELAINPNTIQRAYRELEAEGTICSVPGKGSFVSESQKIIDARRAELLKEFDEAVGELRRLGVSVDELRGRIGEDNSR